METSETMKARIDMARKPTGEKGVATLERMNESHSSLTFWALDLLEGEFDPMLDVGCGGGATLTRLLNKYPQATVYGIDYSPDGVALSQKNNETQLGTRCHITQGSVTELPYEDQTFSLITAFETIYFWDDYAKAFSEIQRVLKPEGLFLVCCEMSDPENPKWKDARPHMALKTGEQWKSLLENNGFTSVRLVQGEGEWICLFCEKK